MTCMQGQGGAGARWGGEESGGTVGQDLVAAYPHLDPDPWQGPGQIHPCIPPPVPPRGWPGNQYTNSETSGETYCLNILGRHVGIIVFTLCSIHTPLMSTPLINTGQPTLYTDTRLALLPWLGRQCTPSSRCQCTPAGTARQKMSS